MEIMLTKKKEDDSFSQIKLDGYKVLSEIKTKNYFRLFHVQRKIKGVEGKNKIDAVLKLPQSKKYTSDSSHNTRQIKLKGGSKKVIKNEAKIISELIPDKEFYKPTPNCLNPCVQVRIEDRTTNGILLEYIPGQDISEIFKNKVPLERALPLSIKCIRAIAYLHKQSVPIVHKDICIENFRKHTNSSIYILDFGVSCKEGTDDIGEGRREYITPEQWIKRPTHFASDTRLDVYQIGILLYRMFSGTFPYEIIGSLGNDAAQLLKKETVEKIAPLCNINSQISTQLSDIVLKCLNWEKEERYKDANDVYTLLNFFKQ